ncbi:hypothetical protein FOH38_23560 [Lysinibacillus fusiformis]|nr:hypothetical protein FOH38_23560 [Lysinibacillus fusiformis]
MTNQKKPMSLAQKLVEIRRNIGSFTKDAKGYNYNYVSGSQVLSKIQNTMNELGVLLIPKVLDQHFKEHAYKDNKGKEKLDFIVYGSMTYVWMNADDPNNTIEVPFYYTGAQDDISKAFGSGLTYSERYFIIKFFNLPTDGDDPDARNTSGRSQGQYQQQRGYQQQGNQKQQQPPQQNRQQGQQQPPQLQPMSPEQYDHVKKVLKKVATTFEADTQVLFNGALQACKIPDKNSKLLTAKEAGMVINYLLSLKPPA